MYLARRDIEPRRGRWSYPGGFLELGEAAQEGARRETEEETELRVEVGRLIGVYSRPHAGVVTIVFEAAVVGGRAEAAAETSEVRAFGPDEIPVGRAGVQHDRERAAGLARRAARPRVGVRAGALRRGRPRRVGDLAADRDARAEQDAISDRREDRGRIPAGPSARRAPRARPAAISAHASNATTGAATESVARTVKNRAKK